MFDEDEEQHSMQTDSEVLLRIDYLDMRVASRIERLEERVRELEEHFRVLNDSGGADLRRLRNIAKNIFGRNGITGSANVSGVQINEKPFPIKTKQTTIALGLLCGLISLAKGTQYSRGSGETLGFFCSILFFTAGIPALLAYLIAGRHQQHSRRDKWYFWGALISSAWVLIRFFNN